LVHKTTQGYFDRHGAKYFLNAQFIIGKECVEYLSFDTFSEGPCTNDELYKCRLLENPLLSYAVLNFGTHVGKEANRRLQAPVLKLLVDGRRIECVSQVLSVQREWFWHEWSQQYPRRLLAIHYSA
jgi:hypothetical protein